MYRVDKDNNKNNNVINIKDYIFFKILERKST
jgi:hypothetical protein